MVRLAWTGRDVDRHTFAGPKMFPSTSLLAQDTRSHPSLPASAAAIEAIGCANQRQSRGGIVGEAAFEIERDAAAELVSTPTASMRQGIKSRTPASGSPYITPQARYRPLPVISRKSSSPMRLSAPAVVTPSCFLDHAAADQRPRQHQLDQPRQFRCRPPPLEPPLHLRPGQHQAVMFLDPRHGTFMGSVDKGDQPCRAVARLPTLATDGPGAEIKRRQMHRSLSRSGATAP
jgi:hypothetical protein